MRSVVLSPETIRQLDEWKMTDTKILAKIITLITECAKDPFTGSGNPEEIKIISCKYHY
jgi:toxin YoeB